MRGGAINQAAVEGTSGAKNGRRSAAKACPEFGWTMSWPGPSFKSTAGSSQSADNAFSRQWHGRETELEKTLPAEAPCYARAAEGNDLDTSGVFAGECVDLIRNVKPAAAIVALIVHEAETALRSNLPLAR
jgi:hypothetical protein